MPISGLDEHTVSVLWFVFTSAALVAGCLLMPVALPGGDVGVLLVRPMAVAWRWLDRPPGSVALAATISVRPGRWR